MNNKIEKFKKCFTSAVHDVLRNLGYKNFAFPSNIKPINNEHVICGPVFTIEGKMDESCDANQTLLSWTELLSKAKENHIWLSQPHNYIVAQMGELSAEVLQKKGVLGCVTDGLIRDREAVSKLNFPCWNVGYTPRDIVGYWMPTSINKTIIIGDVIIEPGDWLHGDSDGIVRIKIKDIDEVIEKSYEAVNTENKIKIAIFDGMDPVDAYKKFGTF